MTYGAGIVGAKSAGVAEVIDPRPFAVGSIKGIYAKYPNAAGILPAMGYSPAQIAELEETIRRTPCDAVVVGTPIDLSRVLKVERPMVRVRYGLREREPGSIEAAVRRVVASVAV
jgi:predicted GTPase